MGGPVTSQPMIMWLASYPKSGNTWLRIFLTNYLRNADKPADINRLGGGPIASARIIFDDYVGVEASDLTPAEIERLRPMAFDLLAAEAKETCYLKVHDAFTYTADGYPLVSQGSTKGVIYLIRNPLDVVVSFAHHTGHSVDFMVKAMGSVDYAFVNHADRVYNQLPQQLLTWSQHVTSWVDESGLDVLVVRYEDSLHDPIASFSRVVDYCGLDYDPERLARAVEFSSFENVRRQEKDQGFGEKSPSAQAFFRRGKVGAYREDLSDELIAQIIADHAPVMRRFGYLDETDRPVF